MFCIMIYLYLNKILFTLNGRLSSIFIIRLYDSKRDRKIHYPLHPGISVAVTVKIELIEKKYEL